jgi:hypothetical protein
MVIDQLPVVNGQNATPRICPNHDAEFPSGLDYAPVCLNGAAIEDNEPAVLLAMREPIIGQLSKPCRAFVAGTPDLQPLPYVCIRPECEVAAVECNVRY